MPLDLPPIRLVGIAPELVLSLGALAMLIAHAFWAGRARRGGLFLPAASSLVLIVSGWFAVDAWRTVDAEGPILHLGDAIAVDGFSQFVKLTLLAFALLTVWLARDYLDRDHLEDSEFYGLVLFATAGMMLMSSAADLIVLFLALETFSIALYVLAGFRRASLTSQEAAMKYFLLGSFSSTFLLMGIALVYGVVGTTALYGGGTTPGVLEHLTSVPADEAALLIPAVGLLIVGLGFKIAAVPFHMWTPDAYEGAPAPVTGFMAAASKLAGFAALIRLLNVVLVPLQWDWRPLVIGIAAATMLGGSILALVQDGLKRVLAYSSIAHAGFVLIGVVASTDGGVAGSLFYLATYGVTVLGAFAIVSVIAGDNEGRTRLSEFRGLFFERPLLAGALTLFLLSLAGVPLTAGFVGKLLVFGAAIDAGYTGLVVVGAIASVVAAFFYLRIMAVMYMQDAPAEGFAIRPMPIATGVVALSVAATLVLGLAWGPLADLAERATLFFAS